MIRREFLQRSLLLGVASLTAKPLAATAAPAAAKPDSKMKLGLVTYLWGEDWDLPTVIDHCTKTGILGVELRTQHQHGVEPTLGPAQRSEVKKRFAQSPVVFVGPGSNECFDHPDPARLAKALDQARAFVRLSHDCGGSGVKVKPNSFHKDVPREKTIEQIGRSLGALGKFAADYGQQIRLEVHGECSPLPIIRRIMDIADHPNVGVCWNSNAEDLQGQGLAYNFNLVKGRLGATAHVRELNSNDYPYQDLIRLFVRADYAGWILLECRTKPADRAAALVQQRELFEKMVAQA